MIPTQTDPSATLQLTHLLGSGNERLCWVHPTEPSKCIKTVKPGVVGRYQNDLDFHYYQQLKARGIGGPHIPVVFGWVETNQGRGLVEERIVGPGGAGPLSISRALESGFLSRERAYKLIEEAFSWFITHSVVVSDCNPEHFVLRQNDSGREVLAVVDGLGGRYLDFRYRLRNRFFWYARRKSRKTWQQLQEMVFPAK